MLQILETLVAIAISLSIVILTMLFYSKIAQKTKAAVEAKSQKLIPDELVHTGADHRQSIIKLYWRVREELHSIWELPAITRQTDRELFRRLNDLSVNELLIDNFHKMYLIYERVRFGDAKISQHEWESFLNDVRSVETLIR